MKLTRQEAAAAGLSKPARKHKYSAQKTVVDGITFPSKAEARRYGELKLMEKSGEIADLQLQPEFIIQLGTVKVCTYRADFSYTVAEPGSQCRRLIVEDVKGVKTRMYRLKKKLVLACHGINVQEV